MKIYAPVTDFNGLRANVMFVKGVGETNDPTLIEWFKSHGYGLGGTFDEMVDGGHIVEPEPIVETVAETESAEPDFDSMNPNELREWMKANGLGMQIKNIRNKEKLLEIIRG